MALKPMTDIGVIDPLIELDMNGLTTLPSDPTHIWIHEGLQVYSESIFLKINLTVMIGVHYLNKSKCIYDIIL